MAIFNVNKSPAIIEELELDIVCSLFYALIIWGYIKRKNEDFLPDRETDSVHYLSVKYSYAEWIVKLWIEQYGEEACEAMLAAGNQTPKLSIRVNTMKCDRESLSEKLKADGFDIEKGNIIQKEKTINHFFEKKS